MAQSPTVTYSNLKHKVSDGIEAGVFKYKDEAITATFSRGIAELSSYLVSFNAPYNEITGTLTSNMELAAFEVRVTPIESTSYGPEEGLLACSLAGIAANTATNFTISINEDTFAGSSSGVYRVSLLAQCSLDYTWDCTQIYTCLNNAKDNSIVYVPNGSDTYEVHDDFVETHDRSSGVLKRAIANTLATNKQDAVADLSDFQIEWYGEYGLKAIFNPVANVEALEDDYYIVLQLLEHAPQIKRVRRKHKNTGRGKYTSVEISKDKMAVRSNSDQDAPARFYRIGADAVNEKLETHERFYGKTVKILSAEELQQGWAILGTPDLPVTYIEDWNTKERKSTFWHYNTRMGCYEAYKQYTAEIYLTAKLTGSLKYEPEYQFFANNVLVKYWYSNDPSMYDKNNE